MDGATASDDAVRSSARAWAPDFYVAALLAPADRQAHLIALAGFFGDVERIVATVGEPAIAEIRLQWWRDAALGAEGGTLTGSPLADRLGAAIRAHGLPFAEFDALLDARALDLYADPLADFAAFAAYRSKTEGAMLRLALACLAGRTATADALIEPATAALTETRLIRTLPRFLARGRSPFPNEGGLALAAQIDAACARAREGLRAARSQWGGASPAAKLACLPIAVVEPYLRASSWGGHDPALALKDIQPLTRMWRMWQAKVLGRL